MECKNALALIAQSFSQDELQLEKSPVFSPIFSYSEKRIRYEFQIFPGHERWGFFLGSYLMNQGAVLREAVDALITEIEGNDENAKENPVLAMEFCGALPAGNNAWQRTGRALSMAQAGIPFLYITEVGGVELDSKRNVKAPRFPNPAVPFAFVSVGQIENIPSLPIYQPSPSISAKLLGEFHEIFPTDDLPKTIKAILSGTSVNDSIKSLQSKAVKMVSLLANRRSKSDKLSPNDWEKLFTIEDGNDRARFFIDSKLSWTKSITISNRTKSIDRLTKAVKKLNATGAGSTNFPICVIPSDKREELSKQIRNIYGDRVSDTFLAWLQDSDEPLVIVWVTGFKPRGDDSRPDRGLLPMARMMFGEKAQVLTLVYGPAKPRTWDILEKNMTELASSNGLWESILYLSDQLLVDSATAKDLSPINFTCDIRRELDPSVGLIAGKKIPNFGEHDVDTVLHMIFSQNHSRDFFECMCNPPGGDWSGISFLDVNQGVEFRWTSLPRVSGKDSKRPDHILQFLNEKVLLSVESKNTYSNLDENIGPRLKKYVEDLLVDHAPISYKQVSGLNWEMFDGETQYTHDSKTLTAIAFKFSSNEEILRSFTEHDTDVVFAVEFDEYHTTLHVSYKEPAKFIRKYLEAADKIFGRHLTIKYHN